MLAYGRTSTTMVFSKKDRSDRSFFLLWPWSFWTTVKRPWSFLTMVIWPWSFWKTGGRSLLNNATHLSKSCKLNSNLKLVWNPKPDISNKFCQILTSFFQIQIYYTRFNWNNRNDFESSSSSFGENIWFLVHGLTEKAKMHKNVFSYKFSKSYPICMKFIYDDKNISSNVIQIDFWWKNYFFRKYLKSHFWALLG